MKETELELLKAAQENNERAITQILAEYKHLVVVISRKYFLIGGEQEDLIQEGMSGLFKAIVTFDVDKSDNFSAYASMLIEREIISAIRHANTGGQQVLSDSILIDNDDELGDNACPESDFINEEKSLALMSEIFSKLSKFEKVVAEHYLNGYNYVDIARMTGKTSKSIDNALSRMKKKLEYLKERL